MTFSAPLKIIVACFAVVALVATAMSGSESAGLKGSRQLQQNLGLAPGDAVNSIIANSFGIVFSLSPQPVVPVGSATAATNTIFSQANEIFKGLSP
jgi:hypothetical protein